MFDSAFGYNGSMGLDNAVPTYQEASFYQFDQDVVNVILTYEDKLDRDFVQNVPVHLTSEGSIRIDGILGFLMRESFPIENSKIFYYSYSNDFFIYLGAQQQLGDQVTIPVQDTYNQNGVKTVTIKVRRPEYTQDPSETERTFEHDHSPQVMINQFINSSSTQASVNNNNFAGSGYPNIKQEELFGESPSMTTPGKKGPTTKRPRTKHSERTVKEVIELVNQWRSLHCGSFNKETNQIVRYSLAEAAKILKVPRKSLDDYLLMMKHAKALGFKFESHLEDKFGALRTYVKNARNASAGGKKSSSEDNDFTDDCSEDNLSTESVSKNSKKIHK